MSLFVAWAAKTVTVNYLGIAVSVPKELCKNGYLSMDADGSIWAYQSKPSQDTKYWASPTAIDDRYVIGLQVFDLSNYNKAIPQLGDSESIAKDVWRNSAVKITDCPVIVF